MRRRLLGCLVAVATSAALGAAMLPFRSHLSVATAGLVLVLPVVAAVITGGFVAGVVGAVAGFLVYDYAFIPPYGVLRVAATREWVALAVYAAIMLIVSRVVSALDAARAEAERLAVETRRLLELSELLVEDRSVDELLKTIVRTVGSAFGIAGVALLVPAEGRLEVAASAGQRFSTEELRHLDARSGLPVSLGTAPGAPDAMQAVALTASGRPVGILALRGVAVPDEDRSLLRIFANHAALAVERAELREQALRTELLEEVDRLRHALMGAVSHDLRTPLATMKVASTTLLDPAIPLSPADAEALYALIDRETDRLTRLVTNLLDLTRFDAGVLQVKPHPTNVAALVTETLAGLRLLLADRPVDVDIPGGLPDVDVDQLLIGQVLANLLENANRHAPPEDVITVAGRARDGRVSVSVSDRGPGVPHDERDAVFDRFVRFDTGGRSGLGLTIAKTFVEAHGERIWVEDGPGGGARFVFTLPTAPAASASAAD